MFAVSENVKSKVDTIQKVAFVVGAIGLVAGFVMMGLNKKEFFQSYLMSFIYFFAIGLGSLALLMIQHVAGGAWGFSTRRLLEAGSRTLMLLAVLFVPLVVLGLPDLYEWAKPDALKDKIIEMKSSYLNVPFFMVRQVIFFSIWIGLALVLTNLSKKEDESADPSLGWWFTAISGPGLVVFAVTAGLTSVDWAMSVDVHWYSSMYPVLFAFGCILSAMIFHTVAMILLYDDGGVVKSGNLEKFIGKNYLRDMGSFILGFIIFWAYLTFSQYLLIWSANLKEEVTYFLNRQTGGWHTIAMILAIGHFVIPFLFLLSRDSKRVRKNLLYIACFLLLMRFFDYLYLLGPSFSPKHFKIAISHFACFAGIGGLWLGFFLYQWKLMPPIAVRDPRLLQEPIHGV